ncbi:RluA family pseudouridine synthase [Alkalicoccus urumqiensis]|nr:RluA family pseudouridine synthase [Alkalicoccus urumqiensis]
MKPQSVQQLREFLRCEALFSRKTLAEVKFNGGRIEVNGLESGVREWIYPGDEITVYLPPETISPGILPVSISLPFHYVDDHLIVLEKPAGLPVIPTSDPEEPSVCGAVRFYEESNRTGGGIHPVQRLDRHTSGLLLFARNRHTHSLLHRMQLEKSVERQYVLEMDTLPWWMVCDVRVPIRRKEGSIIEREGAAEGQYARTRFYRRKDGLIAAFPETGRTHQIRVHAAWCGHPLRGDTLYGGSEQATRGQFLHAAGLSFTHPITNERLQFYSRPSFPPS